MHTSHQYWLSLKVLVTTIFLKYKYLKSITFFFQNWFSSLEYFATVVTKLAWLIAQILKIFQLMKCRILYWERSHRELMSYSQLCVTKCHKCDCDILRKGSEYVVTLHLWHKYEEYKKLFNLFKLNLSFERKHLKKYL